MTRPVAALLAVLLVAGCTVAAVQSLSKPDAPVEGSGLVGSPMTAGPVGLRLQPAVAPAASERPEAWRPALASVPAPLPQPAAATAADVSYSGIINYAEPQHGRYYLAIPDGRGVRVEICGPAGCLIRTSTDAGPDLAMQRAGRIADLNSVDWLAISGVELKYGGFQGTILILRRPARIVLPATDTEGSAQG